MKTGRNDPCPCGSGKKYKKCCLETDEQNSFAQNNDMPHSVRGIDDWEPEDEDGFEMEDENSEAFDEDNLYENSDEDFDEDTEEESDDENEDADNELLQLTGGETELPKISDEETKLVDDWWEQYKKIEDKVKEREHLMAFIDRYPHLVDHLELWHEVLFELGADHFRKGIYEKHIELLLKIRNDFPYTYKQSHEYYDSDLIFWRTAQGRFDEIDMFFSLFRESGKYDENLDDLFSFFRAINRTDILLSSLAGSKYHEYVSAIIADNITSKYLDQPVTEASVRALSDELLANGIDVAENDTDKWNERLLQYMRPFTTWNTQLPKKQSQATDYYFIICSNFAYFLYKKADLSLNSALLYSDAVFDYYRRIVYREQKRPVEIFCINENMISKYTLSVYNTWFGYFNINCFIGLNAFYYFVAYLKTCGNFSEDEQHKLQKMIRQLYQKVYDISNDQGPEMLTFKQFPLWEIKE